MPGPGLRPSPYCPLGRASDPDRRDYNSRSAGQERTQHASATRSPRTLALGALASPTETRAVGPRGELGAALTCLRSMAPPEACPGGATLPRVRGFPGARLLLEAPQARGASGSPSSRTGSSWAGRVSGLRNGSGSISLSFPRKDSPFGNFVRGRGSGSPGAGLRQLAGRGSGSAACSRRFRADHSLIPPGRTGQGAVSLGKQL